MPANSVFLLVVVLLIVGGFVFIVLGPEDKAQAKGGIWHGTASWYSTQETKGITASGARLDDDALTCAMWGVPMGQRLRVTSAGGTVVVTCNDRGPARRLVRQGRVIDLTKAAFARLAPLSRGLIPVTVEEVR